MMKKIWHMKNEDKETSMNSKLSMKMANEKKIMAHVGKEKATAVFHPTSYEIDVPINSKERFIIRDSSGQLVRDSYNYCLFYNLA